MIGELSIANPVDNEPGADAADHHPPVIPPREDIYPGNSGVTRKSAKAGRNISDKKCVTGIKRAARYSPAASRCRAWRHPGTTGG
jgi:hypothetical protein